MNTIKEHPAIACCGIDCGLCPRYYTKGSSRCGGCGGHDFQGNPSCAVLTCCAKNKGLEVCAQCSEYPCPKLGKTVKVGCDSFVTHQKILVNLEDIKANGLEQFLERQEVRIAILKELLTEHDDGRSKSFFCTACALMPVEVLREISGITKSIMHTTGLKERCGLIRSKLQEMADLMGVELRLNKGEDGREK